MPKSRIRSWLLRGAIALMAILLVAIVLFDIIGVGRIKPPSPTTVTQFESLDQNWTANDAHWFHHVSQGTKIMRYDWFMALEQPGIHILSPTRLLHDPEYLQRFGFLPDVEKNIYENALPIGFAVEEEFREPTGPHSPTIKPYKVVGLTCAGCHTGQVNFRGHAIRIEGGHSMVDLGTFQAAVRRSMFYTLVVPGYFGRFAEHVLGSNCTKDARKTLRVELEQLVRNGLEDEIYAKQKHLYDLKGGPGRTDALGLIGNRAFKDLNNPQNLAMADAPVKFPPLWDAPWFEWVQYNASIRPPMVRNIGEALGVGALVITNPLSGDEIYDSSVNVENLHRIESRLSGKSLSTGLRSPVWPSFLQPLDYTKLETGRRLYARNCKGCHPLISELERSYTDASESKSGWTPSQKYSASRLDGRKLIQLKVIDLEQIGTDPGQALNVQKRVVFTGRGVLSESIALAKVTAKIRKRKYDELGLTDDQKREYDADREMPDEDRIEDSAITSQVIAANLGYRPRPLDGVWANAPYLHNGSVPNLFELLSPVESRSKVFFVGGREFDPDLVGFLADEGSGSFKLDTSIPGNLNSGHEFRNLTLAEFERLSPTSEEERQLMSEDRRWAEVLGIPIDDFRQFSAEQRRRVIRDHSAAAIQQLRPTGVLGPEFSIEDRMALIEYLKSL